MCGLLRSWCLLSWSRNPCARFEVVLAVAWRVLLLHNSMYFTESHLMFLRNLSPPSSGLESNISNKSGWYRQKVSKQANWIHPQTLSDLYGLLHQCLIHTKNFIFTSSSWSEGVLLYQLHTKESQTAHCFAHLPLNPSRSSME
jgi:hypothetical protein